MPRTEAERLRIYGPPEFREWADLQACLVVGCSTLVFQWRPDGRGFRELCHIGNGGTGRKGNWAQVWIGCWVHHDESHEGVHTFAEDNHLWVCLRPVPHLMAAAAATHAAFLHSDLGHAWAARLEAGEPPHSWDLPA